MFGYALIGVAALSVATALLIWLLVTEDRPDTLRNINRPMGQFGTIIKRQGYDLQPSASDDHDTAQEQQPVVAVR